MHTLTREQIVQAFTRLDAADIRFLADRRGLRSASDVLDVVVRYVPVERLPVRTRLLLEEMFDDGR